MATNKSLWNRCAAGEASARDALLTEHLSLVHHVARQLSRTLASTTDFDELVSAGTIGLMDALSSFDASRGLAFSTYAVPRIRGAILDELRRLDHVPRSVRRKTRDIGTAREALTRELGRLPEDREIADKLELDVQTLWRWQADVQSTVHVSLDRDAADEEESGLAPGDFLPDTREDSIEDQITLTQEADILREAILQLKEQERVVLTLYYYEELKLHEIAEILELTESRVSQIRTRALARLRTEMAGLRPVVA